MNWGKPKIEQHYTVVELEKLTPIEETSESISAVRSLEHHAGFQYLVRKLKYQAARLRAELSNTRHKDIREVDFLQSGIQWCGWLQQQVDIAHSKYLQMRPATPQEAMHFQNIESTLELIAAQTTEQSPHKGNQ